MSINMTPPPAPASSGGGGGLSNGQAVALGALLQAVGGGITARRAAADYAGMVDRSIGRTEAALAAERERQKALTDANVAEMAKSLGLFQGDVSQEMADRAAALRNIYAQTTRGAPAIAATAPQATGITADAEARFNAEAQARVDNLAAALANLRNFNDVFADKGRQLGRNAEVIDRNRGFMRGNIGALNSELQAAQVGMQTQPGLPLGDLLRGAGQLALTYGLVDQDKLRAQRQVGTTPTPSAGR